MEGDTDSTSLTLSPATQGLILAVLGAISLPLSVWSSPIGLGLTSGLVAGTGAMLSVGLLLGGLRRCWTAQRRFEESVELDLNQLRERLQEKRTAHQRDEESL